MDAPNPLDGDEETPRCHASTLACHLSGRLFNLSPFAVTKLPFLATEEGRRTPLFEFYCYLVDWRPEQRLNDMLKQRAVVMRAKVQAGRALPSHLVIPPPERPNSEHVFTEYQLARSGQINAQDDVAYLEGKSAAFGEERGGGKFLRKWVNRGKQVMQAVVKPAPPRAPPPTRPLIKVSAPGVLSTKPHLIEHTFTAIGAL